MKNPQDESTPRSNGGKKGRGDGAKRPRKPADLHEGKTAAERFKAGLGFVLAGGPVPPEPKS